MTARPWIGRTVTVKVDRPLGSRHPEHGFDYPLNYGSIPGAPGVKGGALDAYVLGVFEPVREFTGVCIAVVHRTDHRDDQLIVVPEGRSYSDVQIRRLTDFQEQWFTSEIWR